MYINPSGNVLIGGSTNTSYNPTFFVKNKSGAVANIAGWNFGGTSTSNDSNNNLLNVGSYYNGSSMVATNSTATGYQQYSGIHVFYTDSGLTPGSTYSNTERMRITSGGTLLVGTPSGPIDGANQKLQIHGSIRQDVKGVSYGEGMIMNFPADGTNYGGFFFHQTSTAMAAVGASSIKWGINYNYMPETGTGAGYLSFAAANTSTRMAITSGGTVLVGLTSPVTGRVSVVGLQVNNEVYSKGSSSGYFWEDRVNSANWGGWYTTTGLTYLYNGSASVCSINMSTGAYTALSDVNKKKDFEESNIGLNEVLQLKPTLFRFKDTKENSQKELGFIAQEVKDYIPQAYVEGDKFIGLNDRPILAAAIKAIQEQQTLITALQEKLERNNII
jgi:hypothetical protein